MMLPPVGGIVGAAAWLVCESGLIVNAKNFRKECEERNREYDSSRLTFIICECEFRPCIVQGPARLRTRPVRSILRG